MSNLICDQCQRVVCGWCGSHDVAFTGEDIDKCRVCGYWRYRGRDDEVSQFIPTVAPGLFSDACPKVAS